MEADSADIDGFLVEQIDYNEQRAERPLADLDLLTRAIAVAARIDSGQTYRNIGARQFYPRCENQELPLNNGQVTRALDRLVEVCVVDRGKRRIAVRIASTPHGRVT